MAKQYAVSDTQLQISGAANRRGPQLQSKFTPSESSSNQSEFARNIQYSPYYQHRASSKHLFLLLLRVMAYTIYSLYFSNLIKGIPKNP